MSERGVFAVDRGWFDHPVFAEERYTEREAWVWLISEAAWKPRQRRIGNTLISLERGQLAASIRFLADKWKWHRNKVDRFLHKLTTEAMIGTETGTGVTIITIRNYNRYQKLSLPHGTDIGTGTGTAPGQQRDKTEDIKSIEEEPSLRSGTRPAKGSRLPKDWKPDEEAMRFATDTLGSSEAAARELAKFSDHWRQDSSQRAVKCDWPAAWRNWCRRAVEMRGTGPPKQGSLSLRDQQQQRSDDAVEQLKAYNRSRADRGEADSVLPSDPSWRPKGFLGGPSGTVVELSAVGVGASSERSSWAASEVQIFAIDKRNQGNTG